MVKRKADPCWVDGPLVREIVEASLVMNVVEESVEEFVADSGAAERLWQPRRPVIQSSAWKKR